MSEIISVYKPRFLTPLQTILRLRDKFPEYQDYKISYAGRLDPLASGVLVLLIGETNKKRTEFEKLDKEYQFKILFGIKTDTGDLLGKITDQTSKIPTTIKEEFPKVAANFVRTQEQDFPAFSSIRIKGKPLFYYARNNLLAGIPIPHHQITISILDMIKSETVSNAMLKKEVELLLSQVKGEFRQDEIRKSWNDYFETKSLVDYPVITMKITCSSGTYIRQLCMDIGKRLQLPALAYSIERTRVGTFTHDRALSLD